MSHVTIKEACRRLEVTDAQLYTTKKYNEFIFKAEDTGSNASFDLKGYLKRRSVVDGMISQVGLLIEFLTKERGWTYQMISDATGVQVQTLCEHSFGYKASLKVAITIKRNFKADFKAYHDFYNYKLTKAMR